MNEDKAIERAKEIITMCELHGEKLTEFQRVLVKPQSLKAVLGQFIDKNNEQIKFFNQMIEKWQKQ